MLFIAKKTFEYARKAQAILIVQLKKNQKHLAQQVKHGCCLQKPLAIQKDQLEKAHGRLEQRTYEVFSARPMLEKWQNDWGLVTNIIRVTRYRERLNSTQKSTQEVHYYVSNSLLSVEKYARAIRQHWYIENKLHHVKDVSFQEDKGLRRINPGIFSTCIDFALNRLRYSGCNNIKRKIYELSLNIKNLLKNECLMIKTSTP